MLSSSSMDNMQDPSAVQWVKKVKKGVCVSPETDHSNLNLMKYLHTDTYMHINPCMRTYKHTHRTVLFSAPIKQVNTSSCQFINHNLSYLRARKRQLSTIPPVYYNVSNKRRGQY